MRKFFRHGATYRIIWWAIATAMYATVAFNADLNTWAYVGAYGLYVVFIVFGISAMGDLRDIKIAEREEFQRRLDALGVGVTLEDDAPKKYKSVDFGKE